MRESSRQRGSRKIITVFLAFVFLVLLAIVTDAPLHWDEGSFMQNAEGFLGDKTNVDQSRPMLLPFLVAALWSFTGESTAAARVIVLLFGVASVFIFYKILSREFRDPLLPLAAFALAPLTLFWSFHVYTDVPALFFFLAALYAYKSEKHLAAGLFIGLATATRFIFGVFAIGMLLPYLLRQRRQSLPYITGGILGASPIFVYGLFAFNDAFGPIALYVREVSAWSGTGLFAATLPNAIFALLMLSGFLLVSGKGWAGTPLVEKSLLVSYSLFILLISGTAFARYWLPVLPLLILMAYKGSSKEVFGIAALTTISVSALVVGGEYAIQLQCTPPFEEAVTYVQNKEGAVVTDNWAIAGYMLDVKVFSPWTSYEELRDTYGVRYAVTRENIPYYLEKSFSNACTTYKVYDLTRPI